METTLTVEFQALDVDDSDLTLDEKVALHARHGEIEMGGGPIDDLMDTLIPEPVYRLNGKLFQGQAAVRLWYTEVIPKFVAPENVTVLNAMASDQGLTHEVEIRLNYRGEEHVIRGVSVCHFEGNKMRGEHLWVPFPFEEMVRELIDLDALLSTGPSRQ